MSRDLLPARQRFLSSALRSRFQEVCELWPSRLTSSCERELSEFTGRVATNLRGADLNSFESPQVSGFTTRASWLKAEGNLASCLRDLACCRTIQVAESAATRPPANPDLNKSAPEARFQLLLERYSCPCNLLLESERDIREELLRQIMVPNRADLEKHRLEGRQHDDILLKLNLLALCSLLADDLRLLDALNYWYERIPGGWVSRGQHRWLLASWIGIYARAVASTALRYS